LGHQANAFEFSSSVATGSNPAAVAPNAPTPPAPIVNTPSMPGSLPATNALNTPVSQSAPLDHPKSQAGPPTTRVPITASVTKPPIKIADFATLKGLNVVGDEDKERPLLIYEKAADGSYPVYVKTSDGKKHMPPEAVCKKIRSVVTHYGSVRLQGDPSDFDLLWDAKQWK
jgi:hypothetical protein